MGNYAGIVGLATYRPDQVWDAQRIAQESGLPVDIVTEKIGVRKKLMPAADDTTSELGIKAAEKALTQTNIDPASIDVVIWCGAQHKDYMNWLAYPYCAYRLGCHRAWGWDMESMCGSMIVAIEAGKSLILSREDVNRVLLVSGYRNCDMINLKDKNSAFLYDIGASGAAVILEKNSGRNEVLGSAAIADGSFGLDFVVPVGGSRSWPMKEEDIHQTWFRIACDPQSFKERLSKVTLVNWYSVIDLSLKRSHLSRNDIDYFAMVKIKRSAHQEMLIELGLREDQSLFLEDFGHLGQNDVILSLEEGIAKGSVKEGDVVLMVSAGGGWTWNALVVQWGKKKRGG